MKFWFPGHPGTGVIGDQRLISKGMDQQLLTAIRLAISGDWDAAHEIVQDRSDALACRIHGYLHRIEGDETNASYWYRQARCPIPTCSVDDEAQEIIQRLESAGRT